MIDPAYLFDVDAYYRSGRGPWTVYAYPAVLADEDGLPQDSESLRYLAELLKRRLPVGIWKHPEIPNTVYFACPFEERECIQAAIDELERSGVFPVGFAHQRCEELFARTNDAVQ